MAWGYYAYIIDDNGHVQNRIEVLCDNDDEAKRCAEQLVDGHAIELWQEARRVATFLRIPVKATMDSDAWRPLDPVDDDQGGA